MVYREKNEDKDARKCLRYVMTMISREPHQIVGFEATIDKCAVHIQHIVDSAPWAENYCTDEYVGYLDVAICDKLLVSSYIGVFTFDFQV